MQLGLNALQHNFNPFWWPDKRCFQLPIPTSHCLSISKVAPLALAGALAQRHVHLGLMASRYNFNPFWWPARAMPALSSMLASLEVRSSEWNTVAINELCADAVMSCRLKFLCLLYRSCVASGSTPCVSHRRLCPLQTASFPTHASRLLVHHAYQWISTPKSQKTHPCTHDSARSSLLNEFPEPAPGKPENIQ